MNQTPNAFGTDFSSQDAFRGASGPSTGTQGRLKSSTKTFAIILLVLGLMGLVTSIVQPAIAMGVRAFMESIADDEAETQQLQQQMDLLLHPLNLAMLLTTLVVSIVLIVCAIGTLRRKRSWANGLRWISCAMIPITLFQSAVGIFFQIQNKEIALKNAEEQFNRSNQGEMPPGMEAILAIAFYAGIGFAVLIGLAFAIFYLFSFLHLSKAETLAQFEGEEV